MNNCPVCPEGCVYCIKSIVCGCPYHKAKESHGFLMPENPELWAKAVELHEDDYLAAIRWYEERLRSNNASNNV